MVSSIVPGDILKAHMTFALSFPAHLDVHRSGWQLVEMPSRHIVVCRFIFSLGMLEKLPNVQLLIRKTRIQALLRD